MDGPPRAPSGVTFAERARIAGLVALVALVASVPSAITGYEAGRNESLTIPPGRETAVMSFLAPVLHTPIAGRDIDDVQIHGGSIRLHTASDCTGNPRDSDVRVTPLDDAAGSCDGDGRVRAGGLCIEARLCGVEPSRARAEAGRIAAALASRPRGGIWNAVDTSPLTHDAGILSPCLVRVGLRPSTFVGWAFAIALALSLAAGWSAGARPAPAVLPSTRSRIALLLVIAVLFVAGSALRWRASAAQPLDGDEPWAFPTSHAVITADHDAWVHPPLHRALQQRWVHASSWTRAEGLRSLRAISVAAAIIALAVIALVVGASCESVWCALPLVPVALAPPLIASSIVARPYALAAAFVTIVFASLVRTRSVDPSRAAWALALVAAGAAAWTDLLAGVAAAVIVVVVLVASVLRARRAALRHFALVVLALSAWMAPLVPGALVAARHEVTPVATGPNGAPDLSAANGMGRGRPLDLARELAVFETLGSERHSLIPTTVVLAAIAACAAAFADRSRSRVAAVVPWALFVVAFAFGLHIGLRPRNVLFLPYSAGLAFALVAGELLLAKARSASTATPRAPTP